MNRLRLAHLLLVPTLALLTACGGGLPDPESIDSHEEAAEAMITTMERLAEVLEGVQDADDAEAAVDDIREITATVEGITNKASELPELSWEELSAINQEYEPRIEQLKDRIEAENKRISADEAMRDILADAMWDLRFAPLRASRSAREGAGPGGVPAESAGVSTSPADPRGLSFTPDPGADPALASLIRGHGKEKVATVVVNNPPPGGPARLIGDLHRALGAGQVMPQHGRDDSSHTYYLAPVDDLRALANKISIGRVDRVDDVTGVITVEYQP